MGEVITVTNVKGGVGKSTTVLVLAEALAHFRKQKVLVIDSDPQSSISMMLLPQSHLDHLSSTGRTLPDLLSRPMAEKTPNVLAEYIRAPVSDLSTARTIALLPSDIRLAVIEREVSRHYQEGQAMLRSGLTQLVDHAKLHYDYTLIDCPAGLSLINLTWLQISDFYLVPAKPDYVSGLALNLLNKVTKLEEAQGTRIAKKLGTLINMKPTNIRDHDRQWLRRLMTDNENYCFPVQIPETALLRKAAEFSLTPRSFLEKYPGDLTLLIEIVMRNFIDRVGAFTEQSKRA